ncbi:DUF447 family protein [Halorubrum sp. GN11_10-6_MGM]|uniref:DUF447 domain-containing protein n=1 Tax=Halorubrum sp. GN11_10-6_MGM TaxID=2518112 RepID=UPI0010F4F7B8|nr:DUF447 domain-containing protein [Halorubrum sp. GN11_10-6_MGM]TKX75309.1 DUF447 family protein [Halorubrum sp. GN11_10-6_MGM]
MSDGTADHGDAVPERAAPEGWPVPLRGVTESVVTTLGPNDRWNVAALGLHAPETDADGEPAGPVTARTYGRTRTWRNFAERGGGVVQFTVDPRTFVDAALTVREVDEAVLPSADAWVEVRAEEVAAETEGDTTIRTWELTPVESEILSERVPTVNRGFGAVVDATVAASRLDVPRFDAAELLDRLRYFADVVERCGGPAEREAFARIDEATGWRERSDEP